MLKAVIFDVDGVLVDSRDANTAFLLSLFREAGYSDVSEDSIRECFHLSLRGVIKTIIGTGATEEVDRVWKMGHDPKLRNNSLLKYPRDLKSTLSKLHNEFILAIVTSRIKSGTQYVLESQAIERMFDVVVTYEDYDSPKPHPEPLEVALSHLGLSPKEAVYVGDSHSDIEAATSAQMWSIHLSAKKHSKATAGIKEFKEVLQAVREIQDQTL